jgi:diguanylate cyclase (GGDEF)-like protein/PAS domain S-box-containing protein
VKNKHLGLRLGVAFAVLIALLAGIGQFGLRRMQTIDENLGEITGKRLTDLELARRAQAISNDNNRIIMQIVLVKDRALIETLLATRSDNSKEITRLVEESERRCDSEKEKQLISAVKGTRKPYLESYLRAIHLHVDEGKHDAAEAALVNETFPALLRYHAAWYEFVEFQNNEVRIATKQAQVDYARARRLVVLLVVLAIAGALGIAVFSTRQAQRSFGQETSAREVVEVELQRSDERMRMAVEAARIGFWDWDVIRDEHVWSNTCKALLGVPLDSQANLQSLMNAVHPDDWKMMRAEIDGAIQEKQDYVVEFRVVRPDNSVHWRTSSGQTFYDDTGQVTRMSGITMDIDERKQAEESLHLQVAALEAAANVIVITDSNGTIVWVNHAFTTMTGYSKEEVLGKNPRLLKSGKQPESYYANLWSTISSGKVWQGEIVNRRKDGTTYTEEMTVTPVTPDVQNPANRYFIAVKQDITDRKREEEELYGSRQMLQSILDAIPQRVFWKDRCSIYLGCNRALATDAGLDAASAIVGKSDFDLSWSETAENYRADDQLVIEQESVKLNFQERLSRPDGSVQWVQSNKMPLRDRKGKVIGIVGTYEDITERKAAEERVQYLAYYDALTGLPNRTLLQDRLAKALAVARRQKYKVALLFLDLDRFKNVNDSLGHPVGDLLLQEVAERLRNFAREQDTVARLGGDEFLLVLSGVKDAADAAVAAERLITAMTAEFVVQGHSLSISCSLGISISPEHGTDAETLIKNADAAMYCAKENGGHNFRFFTEDMNAQAAERLTLESSLRQALDKKELFLMYQPQMNIATGKIIGLEALLRWQQPKLGLVPPDKFIRIAENSGLIVPIGEWVLKTACSQARKWQDEGLPALSVAVNVSAIQFRQEDFCELIKRVLHETGLAPQYLELELTESLLLSNADVTLSVIQDLKAMGLTLAIDDFGTGYSSFSYLRQFWVSKLKIDRSFIRDVAVNPDDAAITTAIISMAKSLNIKVIAEGVEDEAQMSFLRAHQCDEIQGYYFSKPLAVDKVADKLRGDHSAAKALAQASGKQA